MGTRRNDRRGSQSLCILRRDFYLREQLRRCNPERFADSHEHLDRGRLLVVLQHADVRAVDMSLEGQLFLCKTGPRSGLS